MWFSFTSRSIIIRVESDRVLPVAFAVEDSKLVVPESFRICHISLLYHCVTPFALIQERIERY